MPETDLSCEETIREIQKGGSERERMVRIVYKQFFGFVYALATKFRISPENMKDFYTDAVVELDKQIYAGKFKPQSKKACSTFIYQVCKFKCIDYYKKKGINRDFQDYVVEDPDNNVQAWMAGNDNLLYKELIAKYLRKLSPSCQQILQDWDEGYNTKEIQERAGLKNENTVYVTRSKCLKKLKEMLREAGIIR